ncbi:MAG: Brp/Blh family beta-carotene 15,15'-dioxygenase [Flavobacteriaceae bacterium]
MSALQNTILAFILILTVGLLHGSNDLLIIKKVGGLEYGNRWVFLKTILAYLFSIAVILLAFYFYKAYALLFFILISSYHFGQQHLASKWNGYSTVKIIAYLCYGLGIFGMIFATHSESSAKVISAITNYEVTREAFQWLALSAFILFFGLSLANKSLSVKDYLAEGALLLVLIGVFLITDLLLAFALYFAFWHALPSLSDQIKLLYRQPLGKGFASYVRSSYFYWAISAAAFIALLMVLDVQDLQVIELLVYFLAAVTFPHVMVMSRIERLLET